MAVRYWTQIPTNAFDAGQFRHHVAVLPLGATEQHGPHLPLSTDTVIAEGMVEAVVDRLSEDAKVVVLPGLAVTNSVEHTNRAGTLSLGRDLTFRLILEIARGVAGAGLRKLVIINAHGGNVGVMVDASHAIRAELGMLCVATNWMRLGLPDGVIAPDERAVDIHGGQLETAILLALRPDLVDRGQAGNFPSLQSELAAEFSLLRAYGPVGMGWMGDDLNPSGAVGNAAAAREEDGRAIIAYQAEQMVRLLAEVERFTPRWWEDSESEPGAGSAG
ncbi:MAG: creatininase family protein [Hyphomicrobiales bacterium]